MPWILKSLGSAADHWFSAFVMRLMQTRDSMADEIGEEQTPENKWPAPGFHDLRTATLDPPRSRPISINVDRGATRRWWRRRRRLIGALAAGGALFVGGAAVISSNAPITVNYQVTAVGPCDYQSGSEDSSTDVIVQDGRGQVLGTGQLGPGAGSIIDCNYLANFPIDESPDGTYRLISESGNGDYQVLTQKDVVDGLLEVESVDFSIAGDILKGL